MSKERIDISRLPVDTLVALLRILHGAKGEVYVQEFIRRSQEQRKKKKGNVT